MKTNKIKAWVTQLTVIFGLFTLAAMTGCDKLSAASSPEIAAKNFYTAAANNRADEAFGYAFLKDVKQNDMSAVKGKLQMFVGRFHSQAQEKGGLKSVATRVIEQTSDRACVEAILSYGNGTTESETCNLLKEEGRWKIKL